MSSERRVREKSSKEKREKASDRKMNERKSCTYIRSAPSILAVESPLIQ